jgi:outer membrane protein assembly factor BamB
LRYASIWGIFCPVFFLTNACNESKADSTTADGVISSPEPDWPQWRGPRRDGISEAKGLLPRWPNGGPALLWKIDGLGTGWSSPIVVNGRMFVTGDIGDDLVVSALGSDSRLLWQTINGRAWKGSYPGARASCTFSEGRLYHLNAHGRLACLDAATGSEHWSLDILDRFGGKNITWALSESVLVDGGRVVVTPGGARALMAAVDKRGGQTMWTTEPLGEDRASHSSPLLFRHRGRRVIANCSSAHGFGVDADSGELLWTVPLKNQFGVNTASPVFSDGSVFFVTPYAEEGRLYRLTTRGESIFAEHVWSSRLDTVTGCAVLLDDTLFAAGYRREKWWFGLDWATGETKCELKDFTTGAAVYADRRLYCFDERGQVGLLNPTADGLEVTGRFQLITARVRDAWAHPVVHDGRLYLRYHDALWCYDVRVHQ